MTLADRQRPHDQHHQRTLEQQILDALLRIEELLQKREAEPEVEGELADAITNVTPRETPLTKKMTKRFAGPKVDRL
jgi:hypothetical protein